MIKKAEEMKLEIREQMRGGNGNVEIMHILNIDEMKGKVRLFAKITLNPGCSIGMHQHEGEEEAYYILSGTAKVNDNGTERIVKPGDAVLTGNGASHSIENAADKPLEFIAVMFYVD